MEVTYNCPECANRGRSEDTGHHLAFNTDKQVFYCFRCGYKGHGPPPTAEEGRKVVQNTEPFTGGTLLYTKLGSKSLNVKRATKYLESHHLDAKQVAYDYNIMLKGQSIVFPVYRDGIIVYYQERDLYEKRFLNPSITKKPLFWNRCTDGRVCVVVEAYCNAIRLDKWMPACAVFGKFLSEEQTSEIVQRFKRVIVCLDPGELHHALAMSRKLRDYGAKQTRVAVLPLPDGHDVCDMGDEQLTREIKKWKTSLKTQRKKSSTQSKSTKTSS